MPHVPAPLRRRRLTVVCSAAATAALLVAGLTGCDPEQPTPPPTSPPVSSPTPTPSSPSATPTPTPTSQREKDEAAIRQAVMDFYEVTNRVRMDPSQDYNQLKKVAAGELLEIHLGDLKEWRAKSWRSTAPVKVENLSITKLSSSGGTVEATVTYCADSTGVDVVNDDGESQVDRSRDRYPTITSLRRSDSGPWLPYRERDGGDACDK